MKKVLVGMALLGLIGAANAGAVTSGTSVVNMVSGFLPVGLAMGAGYIAGEHDAWAKANPDEAAKLFKTVKYHHKGTSTQYETTLYDFENNCPNCVLVK